jgi:hypothetical protein
MQANSPASHALRAGFKGDRFATPEELRREDAPGRPEDGRPQRI